MNTTSPEIISATLGGWEMLFIGSSIFYVAFWVWMMVDCAIYETSTRQKLVWLAVIILVGVVGAPLYLFVRKLPRHFTALSQSWLNLSEMTMPPKTPPVPVNGVLSGIFR
jgi:hypothetical protein